MHLYELQCELFTPRALDETFRWFGEPRNLSLITPPWLNFQIRTPGEIVMRPGAEIDYTIRWFGLPMTWKTLITVYHPPFEFVDDQVRGPYARWRHQHTFREVDGGVLVGDRVEYALPFGPLGRAAHALMVGPQLCAIFAFRQQAIDRLLGGGCRVVKPPRIIDPSLVSPA